MLDPMNSSDDKQRFMQIAEVAALFVAKYLYTLECNGVSQNVLAAISVNLTSAVISQLLVDPEAARIAQYQRFLQEWEPDSDPLI